MADPVYILGIETSCDETAAAVVRDGTEVLSSTVSSQVNVHHRYGGVVPELASRKHIESVVPVVAQAVSDSGLEANQITAIAVTRGPGLVGALLVGFSFAKAYAYGLKIPLVGVNHLEGHINSVFLEPEAPPFPFVALLASGGVRRYGGTRSGEQPDGSGTGIPDLCHGRATPVADAGGVPVADTGGDPE